MQAHFGKRWFGNILLNLPAAENAAVEVSPRTVAHVTAAGPSLDAQTDLLAARDEESRLIATDTSLPTLLRSAILPDAVVSIDCQIYCYLHFLQGVPLGTPLFLDLASPPLLARRAGKCAFFASGHPLVRYLSDRWKAFPPIDTSGGNVAQAGISLARSLGAETIHVYGADFSYPDGKPYARGTYLFDFFALRESRLEPSEGRFYSFLFRSEGVTKEWTGDGWRYTTPVLLGYRRNLLASLRELDALIIPAKGRGLPLDQNAERKRNRTAHGERPRFSWAPARARCGWREFLLSYADELRGLPPPGEPLWQYFAAISAEQRTLWATLMPLAPSLLRDAGPGIYRSGSSPQGGSRVDALREARRWALGKISRALQAPAE